MLKRAVLVLVIIVIIAAMFTFTYVNTGTIEVDLLFAKRTTSVPVALTVAFVLGWLFGLLCTAIWALKLINERRSLKRSLRVSESEVSSLRSLPLSDAD